MNDILKIAYRNISRNKRRSALTIAVIIMGVAIYVFGMGYLEGFMFSSYERAVSATGEIRMVHPEFELTSRTFDLTSNVNQEVINTSEEVEGVKNAYGRIKFGGMIFSEEHDQTSIGYGVKKGDLNVLKIKDYLIEGDINNWEDKACIILGEKLAGQLRVGIGDEITIMTSTQWRSVSAFNYTVTGIFKHRYSMYNEMFVLPLGEAQYLLDMENSVSEIVFFVKELRELEQVKKRLEKVSDKFVVEAWNEIGMNKTMDDWMWIGKFLIMFIFGSLSSIAIVNTMMMVVLERKREIGVLESMGMNRGQVSFLLISEGMIMGIIGTCAGIIIGIGVTYYFSVFGLNFGESSKEILEVYQMEHILYPIVKLRSVFEGLLIGMIFSLLGTLFPVIPMTGKKPAELLKNR
ncbi:MAG: ABC transporter permease [Candidatus Muiribacteriota bacterium]